MQPPEEGRGLVVPSIRSLLAHCMLAQETGRDEGAQYRLTREKRDIFNQ